MGSMGSLANSGIGCELLFDIVNSAARLSNWSAMDTA